jgi:hypothetical protein
MTLRITVSFDLLRYIDYLKYLNCQFLTSSAFYVVLMLLRAENAVPQRAQQILRNRWILATQH